MSRPETKKTLIQIALKLIWQRDYKTISINEICECASVSKGAFYHHFDSKVDLFVEVTNYYWETIKQDLDTIFSPQSTALQQLENLIHFISESKFSTNKREFPFFNTGMQLGSDNEKIIEALQNIYGRCLVYHLSLLNSLTTQGYLETTDIDNHDLARLMHHYIHGVVDHAYFNQNFDVAKKDLPKGLYRLLSLKREFWYQTKPNFTVKSILF